MSRILKVSQGDYKVQVERGGNIILDTGTAEGTVTITGNLEVLGIQTVIESTNSYIKDNKISLNYDQKDPYGGDGIPSVLDYEAGIEIWRGSRGWADFIFTETEPHYDTLAADDIDGTFVLRSRSADSESTALSGIKLKTVVNSGTSDLGFDLRESQNFHLRIVNGPSYYEQGLFTDIGGMPVDPIQPPPANTPEDNYIPNRKFVQRYVSATGGIANVTLIHYPLTGVYDSSVECTESTINFAIGASIRAQISSSGVAIDNLALGGDTITNSGINNLILTATNNNVEVDAVINLNNQGSDPTAVSGTTKLYTKSSEGPGRTGIYFTNDVPYGTNSYNQDELVSKNRAVLLSILL